MKLFQRKPAILIVEDEECIASCLADLLRDEGYAVATARNGREGLDLIERTPFAVILLDLAMPVMDGRTFNQALRQAGHRTPVVLMTANRDIATSAHELGASAYLQKPFSIDDALTAITDVFPARHFGLSSAFRVHPLGDTTAG
jgi:CheY-like chemotaxis protein